MRRLFIHFTAQFGASVCLSQLLLLMVPVPQWVVFRGSLAGVSAPELGATAIRAAVERAGLQPSDVEEVIMGAVYCLLALKQGPARQAMRQAGLPDNTGAVTINKLCGFWYESSDASHRYD